MKRTPLLRAIYVVMIVLLASMVFVSPVFSAEPVEVDAKRVKEMMDGGQAVVIFPLSSIEFNNLHIEDSIHIPIEQIPAGLPDDKMQSLVFYCLGRT